MNTSEIISKAIATYGEREQSAVTMEELAELIRAINKYHRKQSIENRDNLIEEIADVEIMIEQVKMMYRICEITVSEYKIKKLYRLEERLK